MVVCIDEAISRLLSVHNPTTLTLDPDRSILVAGSDSRRHVPNHAPFNSRIKHIDVLKLTFAGETKKIYGLLIEWAIDRMGLTPIRTAR